MSARGVNNGVTISFPSDEPAVRLKYGKNDDLTLTIICPERSRDALEIHTHNVILKEASPFFEAWLKKEGDPRKLTLVEGAMETLKQIVVLLYNDTMTVTTDEEFANLIHVARKYQFHSVEARAVEVAQSRVSPMSLKIYHSLAEHEDLPTLLDACMKMARIIFFTPADSLIKYLSKSLLVQFLQEDSQVHQEMWFCRRALKWLEVNKEGLTGEDDFDQVLKELRFENMAPEELVKLNTMEDPRFSRAFCWAVGAAHLRKGNKDKRDVRGCPLLKMNYIGQNEFLIKVPGNRLCPSGHHQPDSFETESFEAAGEYWEFYLGINPFSARLLCTTDLEADPKYIQKTSLSFPFDSDKSPRQGDVIVMVRWEGVKMRIEWKDIFLGGSLPLDDKGNLILRLCISIDTRGLKKRQKRGCGW